MKHVTVTINDTDYADLEHDARVSGVTIQGFLEQLIARQYHVVRKSFQPEQTVPETPSRKNSRWAKFSERIQSDPPLQGAGEYVRQAGQEFREDFALSHDEA